MDNAFPIHDLWIRHIVLDKDGAAGVWHVLDFDDHILLRLGALQVVHLPPGAETSVRAYETSDEVWALVGGRVLCVWKDLRADSPTHQNVHVEAVDHPTAMLAPFGVAFGVRAVEGEALLLRLMTSSEQELGAPQTIPWPDSD